MYDEICAHIKDAQVDVVSNSVLIRKYYETPQVSLRSFVGTFRTLNLLPAGTIRNPVHQLLMDRVCVLTHYARVRERTL